MVSTSLHSSPRSDGDRYQDLDVLRIEDNVETTEVTNPSIDHDVQPGSPQRKAISFSPTRTTPPDGNDEQRAETPWQRRVQKELELTGLTPWEKRKRRQPPTPTPQTTPSPKAKDARNNTSEHDQREEKNDALTPPKQPQQREPVSLARVQLAAQKANAAVASPKPSTPKQSRAPTKDFQTPEGFVEPQRNRRNGDFLDRDYEKKVREQHYAVKKAFPHFLAQEIDRPISTPAQGDRMLAFYRTALEKLAVKTGHYFDFDQILRARAEEQVRWQGTPSLALEMLTETLMVETVTKTKMIEALDKAPKHKRRGLKSND
jgi:hypothetical protein